MSAENYLSLLMQFKDILKDKCVGKFIKVVLDLHDITSAHRALATRKKLAYLGLHCLDHPPYSPYLGPSGYRLFPGLKINCKVSIFRPSWRSLLPRRPGLTDNILNFFEWLVRHRERSKNCIGLRGDYVT
jgi:hypothetical protein